MEKGIVFRSKIGWELMVPIFAILGGVSTLMVLSGTWAGLLITGSVCLLIIYLCLETRYVVHNDILKIKGGIVFKDISIHTIRKIKKSRDISNAPALSLDRLEIWFNKYDCVLVSPKDKSGFIELLRSINKEIEVS
ncbi:MAG: hypothetical protein EOP48_21735 [Sphingobacteriales bacterium]|nr:MAG: hypothetical protein EOP48_21735 [Sphingobacteriales bacterium]